MTCQPYLSRANPVVALWMSTAFVVGAVGASALADPAAVAERVSKMLETPHHSRQLLVRFNDSVSEPARGAAHTSAGAVQLKGYQHVQNLYVVDVPDCDLTGALNEYLNNPDVMYAEPDYKIYPTGVPNDPDFGVLWGMHNIGQEVEGQSGLPDADIHTPEAWDLSTGDGDSQLMGGFVLTGRPIMPKFQ